jgi:hypothetical protein
MSSQPTGRQRGQALQNAAANPVQARLATLKELSDVLQDIPRAYQQHEFSAIAQAIRILETGDMQTSVVELERACGEMDTCLKKVSAVYEAGFTSALSSYSVIFDHMEPCKEQVHSMSVKLRAASQALTPATSELGNLLLQLETTEHIIELLTRIEALARVG